MDDSADGVIVDSLLERLVAKLARWVLKLVRWLAKFVRWVAKFVRWVANPFVPAPRAHQGRNFPTYIR